MPSNIEVEQAVLGALLLSKEKYPEVDALINSSDFESDLHKEIYDCIKELADQGKGIDHITVSKLLERKNSLQRVGGIDYLKELQTIPISALAADSYANLVKDQSIDRNLKKVLDELMKTVSDPKGKSSDELLNEAEAKIFELSENRSKTDSLKKIEEFVGITLDKLEELSQNQGELIGSSSGFKAIDGVTQGLQDEDPAGLVGLLRVRGRHPRGRGRLPARGLHVRGQVRGAVGVGQGAAHGAAAKGGQGREGRGLPGRRRPRPALQARQAVLCHGQHGARIAPLPRGVEARPGA